ncbi:porin [Polaromonas hydrogenivorans]|uniref:Porin n=1 Tax=Polaromonas hydrogenivorans TaxID=335476 RepID=A0AAU7LQ05_9BURK
MKKSLIALAVLAASGAAMAQSSVTLYGIADAFVGSKEISSVNAAGVITKQRQTVVDSSGLNGSRWGLKGSEDLGGGLKALFVLESGLNIDTGAAASGTSLFNRQAFVGLDSSFGTVSLGRQYSAYDSVRGTFLSAQGNSTSFDATNSATINTALLTGLPNTATPAQRLASLNSYGGRVGAWTGYQTRIDNSIRYATPNISGFQAAVVYGLGENKTPTTDATKNASVSLTYANGPIGVGVTHADDELIQDFHVKNTAIGGYYDFGVAKAFLAYNQAKITGLAKQKEWAVGVRAPLGATTLVAQYAQSKGDDLGKSTSVALEGQYSLSKRTTAYAAFNRTKVDLPILTSDFKNSIFGLGVRHAF